MTASAERIALALRALEWLEREQEDNVKFPPPDAWELGWACAVDSALEHAYDVTNESYERMFKSIATGLKQAIDYENGEAVDEND